MDFFLLDGESKAKYSIGEFLGALLAIKHPPSAEDILRVSEMLKQTYGELEFICDILKVKCGNDIENGFADSYSYSTIEIGGYGSFSLRANVWKPNVAGNNFQEGEEVFGLAHNHDFHLISKGILGAGYKTDIYNFDNKSVLGYFGEKSNLIDKGSYHLHTGNVIYYPQYRVTHVQHPPEEFSISLNVIPVAIVDSGQFTFDVKNDKIDGFAASKSARILSLMTSYVELSTLDDCLEKCTKLALLTDDNWLRIALGALLVEKFGMSPVENLDWLPRSFEKILNEEIDPHLFGARHIKVVN